MSDHPSDEPTLPLDEFCQEVSRDNTAVELIAAFRYRELASGCNHDTRTAYAERYAATHGSPTAGNTLPVSV